MPLSGQERGMELINSLWTREKRKKEKENIFPKHLTQTHTYIHAHTHTHTHTFCSCLATWPPVLSFTSVVHICIYAPILTYAYIHLVDGTEVPMSKHQYRNKTSLILHEKEAPSFIAEKKKKLLPYCSSFLYFYTIIDHIIFQESLYSITS
jgi:hypothetical protein